MASIGKVKLDVEVDVHINYFMRGIQMFKKNKNKEDLGKYTEQDIKNAQKIYYAARTATDDVYSRGRDEQDAARAIQDQAKDELDEISYQVRLNKHDVTFEQDAIKRRASELKILQRMKERVGQEIRQMGDNQHRRRSEAWGRSYALTSAILALREADNV